MTVRISQCMEPKLVGGSTFFCVEPVGHQCAHTHKVSMAEFEQMAERAERAESDAASLRADLAAKDETIQTLTNMISQPTEVPRLHLENEALRALLREALAEDNMWAGMRDKFRAALDADTALAAA